ncbi:DUF1003 domain-containing protein [Aureimonas sp. AU4]|uniref:DUF1003 domain-containing protein n=1 Tax=Aureimonas sp. AU4 TaxID=1638163 RepID=UPI00078188A8|nr:DUF1003 domain-containing protein [Aureimonas sp. AU4]
MDPIRNGRSLALRIFGRPLERLKPVERRVLESSRQHQPISSDVNDKIQGETTFGDRLADAIARVGGSWSFIIGFLAFLAAWVVMNSVLLVREAFDPYPYIFLNLVLSMIAAIQAPIIMMSQNRAAKRDRLDASLDYEVNLKAEIEIMALHEKLDDMRREASEASLREALLAMETRLARIELGLQRRDA